MIMDTIKVDIKRDLKVLEITLNRPDINVRLLTDLRDALDLADTNLDIRTIVLRGNDQFFCSGMDFKEKDESFASLYAHTLKRLTTIPKTVVSICEGKVLAGGVGFVAASDIVIANPSAIFSLSELIWGLLPANV